MPANENAAITLPAPEPSQLVKSMQVITDSIDATIVSPFPSLTHWWIRQTPSYRRARMHQAKHVHERLYDAERRLVKGDIKKNNDESFHAITCATDHMVRREAQMAAKEGRKPVYNSPSATDELLGFLVAGHETTATTVMWIVKYLGEYPAMQTKLRDALHAAYPSFAAENKLPTVDALVAGNVPYLDAAIEEIMRLSLTVLGTSRATTREVTVLGHVIPKGVEIQLLCCGAGFVDSNAVNETIPEAIRSASSREHKGQLGIWDDADVTEFKPERWLKRNPETGEEVFDMHAGPSLQFGGGLRGCFGKRLAYLEMRILVTIMVWTFEMLPMPEGLGGFEAYDTLTHKPSKCYARLRETGKGN